MPAAAVKGILISISIIAALGIAVLENPQIQAWLEQQRQKLIELLRTLNEELDPQSRRTAEAFAFQGRTPANDAGLRREMSGSLEAAAVATGRSLSSPSTMRRIPVQGPAPDEAEERRRKGREYLANRNQQMYELKQRKKTVNIEVREGSEKPASPTSFDEMVDEEGNLRQLEPRPDEAVQEMATEPSIEDLQNAMRSLVPPTLVAESSSSTDAWQLGSQLANPFGDEFAMDRSATPKPPVPPKIAIETAEQPHTPAIPGSFSPRQMHSISEDPETRQGHMDFEEQLAIALSLSEAEARRSAINAAQQHDFDSSREDADLRQAIAASLKEIGTHEPSKQSSSRDMLVDVSVPALNAQLHQPVPRGHWENVFDQNCSPIREPLSLVSSAPIADEEEDELYRVTPQLTQARLATLDARHSSSPSLSSSSKPYDPVREAAGSMGRSQIATPAALEASFYSATSSAPSPATTHTMDHETKPQLIDVSEDAEPSVEGTRTPVSRAGFFTDSDSESETFASISPSASASRAQSRPRSEVSNVEVVDLLEDSDVDMLSEEGDGVATPDSWTEVGSRDGESEVEEDEERVRSRWRGIGAM